MKNVKPMNLISAHLGVTRRTAMVKLAFVVGGLLPLAGAMACTADADEVIDSRSLVYREAFSAGDVITDWSNGARGNYLDGCAENTRVRLSIVATGAPIDTVDDIPVFATDNANVGIQFQYQFNQRRGENGGNYWSSWQDLTTTPASHLTYSFVGPSIDTEYVGLNYRARFVALRSFSGDQRVGRTQVADVTDLTYGIVLNQRVFESFRLDAPIQRSCGFRGAVDGRKVELPFTHASSLRKEGDVGQSAEFSWGFRCDYGNVGEEEAMGIRYSAGTTLVDAEKGLMSVTGGAQGVDLQVRRREGGSMVPVGFAEPGNSRWVRYDEEEGTEYLDVRYVRNADPMVPGPANGSLVIYIEPW
jgi:type 1 fimbria pilin